MDAANLLLGVDGGGTKTVAWLATLDQPRQAIGCGWAGPSNYRSVGWETATTNLVQAITAAFADANVIAARVASACLGLAGAGRAIEQEQIRFWAEERDLAAQISITSDIASVLYAVSNEGVGVALIAGTGSLAWGRNANGETARCGGWGGLLGDEGSGYQISIAALRAAARAADGRGAMTSLLPTLIEYFEIKDLHELIPIVYSDQMDRAKIAGLAPLVFAAADERDEVAETILATAIEELAKMVSIPARDLGLADSPFVVAVAGGVLLHQPSYVGWLRDQLVQSGLQVDIQPVPDPVVGSLQIAAMSHSDSSE